MLAPFHHETRYEFLGFDGFLSGMLVTLTKTGNSICVKRIQGFIQSAKANEVTLSVT